ncbi:hypothetical protein Csa_019680 [Cucumis sativus]|uniref:Uncharacterized protein n=1 Tax=Cucumis sativus TaxID=3659 RepID=A0A0A0LXM0_CUCSA|nr:hypothetical protein Csa_019680 [Cucumis sativus]
MLSIVIGCGYSFLGLIHLFVAVPRLASLLTEDILLKAPSIEWMSSGEVSFYERSDFTGGRRERRDREGDILRA